MKRKTIFRALLTIGFLALVGMDIFAQCPMCRMSAESNLRAGGTAGAGLNAGILYMLSMPYLLVLTFAIIYYRNRNRDEDEEYNLSSMK